MYYNGSMKKLLLGIAFSILPIVAVAQFSIEREIPVCSGQITVGSCWDGISYAYLIEKKVALSDYPKDATEFALIVDSLK